MSVFLLYLRRGLLAALLAMAVLDLGGMGLTPLVPSAWADDGDGGDGGGSGGASGSGGDDGDDGGGADGSGGGDGAGSPLVAIARFVGGEHARDEVIAAPVSEAQLQALRERGYEVLQRAGTALLPTTGVRLRVPRGRSLDQAIAEIEALNPNTVADRNHFYRYAQPSGSADRCPPGGCEQAIALWARTLARCRGGAVHIAMLDSGLDLKHPALVTRRIETLVERAPERRPASPVHGTAVASLLVGDPASDTPGLLPQARLTAVDVFYRAGLFDERADAFAIVTAFDAVVRRGARVVNFSFAGPPNRLLERSVQAAYARGVLAVAAVGNDGAEAPPRYPAAYASVLAVTAVDAHGLPYRDAGRGEHVDFAAPGVGLWAARAGGGRKRFSGTSFAAPFVTAAAATVVARSPRLSPAAVQRELARVVRDAGDPGADPIYGLGVLDPARLCTGRSD